MYLDNNGNESDRIRRVLVQADGSLPAPEIVELVLVARDLGYAEPYLMGLNPSLALPPFEGPPRVHRPPLAVFPLPPSVEIPTSGTWAEWVAARDAERSAAPRV